MHLKKIQMYESFLIINDWKGKIYRVLYYIDGCKSLMNHTEIQW